MFRMNFSLLQSEISIIYFLLFMQDDIIPRLSVASLKRLRNEIVETDW